MPFLKPTIAFGLLAFSGGITVYVNFDELLPAAHKYGEAHLTMLGIAVSMIVMAVTLDNAEIAGFLGGLDEKRRKCA
jgi:ZIP family zinc transporter